jgi:hypothetical protein
MGLSGGKFALEERIASARLTLGVLPKFLLRGTVAIRFSECSNSSARNSKIPSKTLDKKILFQDQRFIVNCH